jgi:membrane protein DedA with SNARE-associated domain
MLSYIIAYKYFGLITLAIFEGPIISVIGGCLSKIGYLELPLVIFLLVTADIISDLIYYHLGYYSSKNKAIEKLLNKKLSKKVEIYKEIWNKHFFSVVFFGKLAYGISVPIIMSAGALNIGLRKFLSYSVPISLLQTSTMVFIGYLLGEMYYIAIDYLLYPLLFFSLTVILLIFIIYGVKFSAKKIILK